MKSQVIWKTQIDYSFAALEMQLQNVFNFLRFGSLLGILELSKASGGHGWPAVASETRRCALGNSRIPTQSYLKI